MYKFFIKILFFMTLVMVGVFILLYMADGSTDAFYKKFTSDKQNSLIIGSSRAAQGLQPSFINKILKRNDIYNYAFTLIHTPFGEPYYRSVKSKLKTEVVDGIFILEVSPWILSELKDFSKLPNKKREYNTFIDKTRFVNIHPNPEYLIESFKDRYLKIITNKYRKSDYQTFFVHDDGWLEVKIVSDLFSVEQRTSNKIKKYRKDMLSYKALTDYRFQYLSQMINLLKDKGEVVMVRIPIDNKMLAIENELSPNFNKTMKEFSEKNNVPYINATLKNKDYNYTDGNHLNIESGKRFSIYIANTINELFESKS